MKVCFITYGCRVNQAESQWWEIKLGESGYEICYNTDEADVWIVNTCAVTHKAEAQSRQLINRAKKLNKRAVITGCYVDFSGIKGKERNITFLPNAEKDFLLNLFEKRSSQPHSSTLFRHRAIVKVQDGCNNFCSYCIVPYVRGKPKSKNIERVIEEIDDYVARGINEIVLSGINLSLYGADLGDGKPKLNRLITKILEWTKIERLRLSSLEVNHVDSDFLELLDSPKICKHLHIPLQSGSDRVLKLMNRPYTAKHYVKKIERILERFPEISIGTDVIVGFPSESDEDFRETLKVLNQLPFSYIHVFTYSRRPKTLAFQMKEQLREPIKRSRAQIVGQLGFEKRLKYLERFLNRTLKVVVENKKNGLYQGTSDNYIKCAFEGDGIKAGDLVEVKVERVDSTIAIGSVVNQPLIAENL